MQEYLFSKQELNLIKFLKTETPFRIWSDPIEYIFEYVDFYIALQIKCVKSFNLGYIIEGNKNSFKDSQLTQYVLKAKLEKVNNKYIFTKHKGKEKEIFLENYLENFLNIKNREINFIQ